MDSLGPSQFIQALVVSLAWMFDAQQTFISVFADRSPNWHCINNTTMDYDSQCSSAKTFCDIPRRSWSWDEPSDVSTVSDWDLDCYGAAISVVGFPASAFFAGCIVGGFLLASLGDTTLGRKKMLCFATFVMSSIGLLTAFSPNVLVYSFLRFLTGIARATIGTSALVLATEIVGSRWRGRVGVIGFSFFTFGFLSLPAISYATQAPWGALYIWTSLPSFFYSIVIFFYTYESPRWLLVRGRREEAIRILNSMGSSSNGNYSVEIATSFFDELNDSDPKVGDCNNDAGTNLYSALKLLFKSRWALRRMAGVITVGFGVGFLYYGLPLAVGNLDVDLSLIITLNAISEFPSLILTILYVDQIKRKTTMLLITTATGAASLACVFVHNTSVQIAIEVSAFFGIITAFNLMLIYTLELFPTCVRNSAVAMMRQAQFLGGVFSPIMVAVGKSDGDFWSFGVFGLIIGFCGLPVIFLPETRSMPICDTMEQQEQEATL